MSSCYQQHAEQAWVKSTAGSLALNLQRYVCSLIVVCRGLLNLRPYSLEQKVVLDKIQQINYSTSQFSNHLATQSSYLLLM